MEKFQSVQSVVFHDVLLKSGKTVRRIVRYNHNVRLYYILYAGVRVWVHNLDGSWKQSI